MAVKFPFVEPILKEIRQLLFDLLPDRLSAITAEFNDNTDLPMFAINDMFITDKEVITRYPSLEIIASNSSLTRRISTPSIYDVNYQISNYVTVAGMDEETIAIQLYRYMRAIGELCEENTTLNGKAYDVIITGMQYIPTQRSNVFLKSGWVALSLLTREGV